MKKIKVELSEPFEIKITLQGSDFFKATFKVTDLKGEQISPQIGKSHYRMKAIIEQGDSMFLQKTK